MDCVRERPAAPKWSDAWLLVALVYGKGDPATTIAAADAFNHAIPAYSEWTHAGRVLGPRGLIEPGDPIPRPTSAGAVLVDPSPSGKRVGMFVLIERVRSALDGIEPRGAIVPMPEESVFGEAYEAYLRASRRG